MTDKKPYRERLRELQLMSTPGYGETNQLDVLDAGDVVRLVNEGVDLDEAKARQLTDWLSRWLDRKRQRATDCQGPDCPRDGDCPEHGRNRPGQTITLTLPWKRLAKRLYWQRSINIAFDEAMDHAVADVHKDELIAQVREARAHARRADEAIRCVAEMLEQAHAAWAEHHGHMPPSALAPLQQWLRRDYVRIVRGEPRT